ncbi:MAG: flagellar motor switch protein FliN [Pseudomonadales bacterium]|nr:flagellar motor switch protein FliN [Pseudomonadales bacterium]
MVDENSESLDKTVQKAKLEQLDAAGAQVSGDVNLDLVMDLEVTLSMEVGRSQITIGELLKLNQGSVIELDRLTGDALDVMVNGKLVAHGEVVVVNEKFGIYLTDVVDTAERVKQIGS